MVDLDLAWVLATVPELGGGGPVLALLQSDNVDAAEHCYTGFGAAYGLTVVATADGVTYRPTGHTVTALLCANNVRRSKYAPTSRAVNHPANAYVLLPGAVVGHDAFDLFDVYLPVELAGSGSGSGGGGGGGGGVWFVDSGDRRVMCISPPPSSLSSSLSGAGEGFAVLCPTLDELRAVPALGRALSSTCFGEVRLCERLVRVRAPGGGEEGFDDQPVFARAATPAA